jgi:hypothetical protein
MNTRLITPDGFPRADLDVAQSTYGLPSMSKTSLTYHQSERLDPESFT